MSNIPEDTFLEDDLGEYDLGDEDEDRLLADDEFGERSSYGPEDEKHRDEAEEDVLDLNAAEVDEFASEWDDGSHRASEIDASKSTRQEYLAPTRELSAKKQNYSLSESVDNSHVEQSVDQTEKEDVTQAEIHNPAEFSESETSKIEDDDEEEDEEDQGRGRFKVERANIISLKSNRNFNIPETLESVISTEEKTIDLPNHANRKERGRFLPRGWDGNIRPHRGPSGHRPPVGTASIVVSPTASAPHSAPSGSRKILINPHFRRGVSNDGQHMPHMGESRHPHPQFHAPFNNEPRFQPPVPNPPVLFDRPPPNHHQQQQHHMMPPSDNVPMGPPLWQEPRIMPQSQFPRPPVPQFNQPPPLMGLDALPSSNGNSPIPFSVQPGAFNRPPPPLGIPQQMQPMRPQFENFNMQNGPRMMHRDPWQPPIEPPMPPPNHNPPFVRPQNSFPQQFPPPPPQQQHHHNHQNQQPVFQNGFPGNFNQEHPRRFRPMNCNHQRLPPPLMRGPPPLHHDNAFKPPPLLPEMTHTLQPRGLHMQNLRISCSNNGPRLKRSNFETNVVPLKQIRMDGNVMGKWKKKPVATNNQNLQEIQTVDVLPTHTVAKEVKTENKPSKPSLPEEDEQTAEYRRQIEEQAKKRMEILQKKEERRRLAAAEKQKRVEEIKQGNSEKQVPSSGAATNQSGPIRPVNVNCQQQFKVVIRNDPQGNIIGKKKVVVKPQQLQCSISNTERKTTCVTTITRQGKPLPSRVMHPAPSEHRQVIEVTPTPTVMPLGKSLQRLVVQRQCVPKKGPVSQLQNTAESDSVPQPLHLQQVPSSVVVIENLASDTTMAQLRKMCAIGGAGKLEEIKMRPSEQKAVLHFVDVPSAEKFVHRYHRSLINLSVISVKHMN